MDVIQFLSNVGSSSDTLILIGGPSAVGAVTAVGLFIWIYYKRKKQARDFDLYQQQDQAQELKSAVEVGHPKPDVSFPQPAPVELSWSERLLNALAKTKLSLSSNISSLLSGHPKKIEAQLLDQIHQALFKADLGVTTADKLTAAIRKQFPSDADVAWEDIQGVLKREMLAVFRPASSVTAEFSAKPHVILVVGVNGVGKTTSIAKLANYYKSLGKSVLLCASDTYRAAAIDQLVTWGERLSIDVIKQQQGSDPAAVAFDSVKAAKARDVDVLIIDTAGRLHNNKELMDELAKIRRIVQKEIPDGPHETLLVIDATMGQNAKSQVQVFKDVTQITGLVVTKLDGTAKGGVIVGIVDQFKIPVKFIGIGEKMDDLRNFEAELFVNSLV